jgi:hypothetical protein
MRPPSASASLLRRWLALRARQHQDTLALAPLTAAAGTQSLLLLVARPPSTTTTPSPPAAVDGGWWRHPQQLRAYAPRRPFRSGGPIGQEDDENENDEGDNRSSRDNTHHQDQTRRRRPRPEQQQPQQRRPPRPLARPPSNPEAELTRRVRLAATPADLLRLLRREGRDFNPIHVVAAMQQAATLGAGEPQQQQQQKGQKRGEERGAGASRGPAAPTKTAMTMAALVARLADGPFRRALPQCGVREAAAGLGALARLREPAPPGLVDAVARELLAWGKVGSGGGSGAFASSEGTAAAAQERDDQQGVSRGRPRVGPKRGRPHQSLTQLSWALARLHQLADGGQGQRQRQRQQGAAEGGGGGGGGEASSAGREPDWATQRACERLLRHAARALAAPGALESMVASDAAMAAWAVAAVLPGAGGDGAALQAMVVEAASGADGGRGRGRRSRASNNNNNSRYDDADYDLDAPGDFARALGEALARGFSPAGLSPPPPGASDAPDASWASPGPRAVVSLACALRALRAPGPEAVDAVERAALVEAPRMKPRELLAAVRALRGLRRQWPLQQQQPLSSPPAPPSSGGGGEEGDDDGKGASAAAPALLRLSPSQVELAVLFGERCFLGEQAESIQASEPAVARAAAAALEQAAASEAAAVAAAGGGGGGVDGPLARRLEAALKAASASAVVMEAVAERGADDADDDDLATTTPEQQQHQQKREETV